MLNIRNIFLTGMLILAVHNVKGQNVMTLEQVLRAVDEGNPSLRVFEARGKSQDAKVAGAKAWMAPMIGVGTFMTPYPGSEVMGNENKGALMFSLEQDIPNPAKTRAKSQYLEAQSKITQAERSVAFNELRARSKSLYYDLLIMSKKITLQRENQAIMQNMKKLAAIRYPYNQGGLNQVFKAEGREYEAENMIQMTEGEIRSKKAALNALMNRPPDTFFEVDTSFKAAFKPKENIDSAYLSANRSDIAQMDRTIAAMQLNIEQMRKEAKPDFRLKFDHMKSYSSMMPAQFTAMGMLSIPIAPWSSGMFRSEVKSMKFEVDAMRQQRVAMLTEMTGMTRSMEEELQSMQTSLSNYEKKIIPALNKNLSVSMLSYQENKLDLNTVIDAWEAKTMAQMNYLDQLQKFYQMLAEYEKILRNKCLLLSGLFFLLIVVACGRKNDKREAAGNVKYTCPMHPGIVRDEPGDCPVCGMHLVKAHSLTDSAARSSSDPAPDSLGYILKRPDEVVVASVSTTRPLKGIRYQDAIFKGVISYNTRNFRVVSSRVGGRIEHLYVKYNYQQVQKGQKLMDVYSPDLANAQQELLFLKDNSTTPGLLDAARRKLRLLGASDGQIEQVYRTGKINYRLSIYSPYSGYVTEGTGREGVPVSGPGTSVITSANSDAGAGSMGGMGNASLSPSVPSPQPSSGSPLSMTEGAYVSMGQMLFNIINDSSVWAEFYVPQGQLSSLRKGEPVQVELPDIQGQHSSVAQVTLIQPYFKEGTNFSLVRATLGNPGKKWKAGQIINVTAKDNKRSGNWILRSAVLRLGTHYVVFEKRDGAFVPRYVKALATSGDWYDIGDSLPEGTEVAENAWFMVDSESFVRLSNSMSAKKEDRLNNHLRRIR